MAIEILSIAIPVALTNTSNTNCCYNIVMALSYYITLSFVVFIVAIIAL